MARTGSGKTAAFLIPMFEKLKGPNAQTGARALILTPTRELALQTMKFTKEVRRSGRRGYQRVVLVVMVFVSLFSNKSQNDLSLETASVSHVRRGKTKF